MRVYLDHHATTPMLPLVRDAITAAMTHGGANPSSVHAAGRRARALIEDARERVARSMGASSRDLVFTSGGTEAVQLAVLGVGEGTRSPRVLCDPGAHPCLHAACEALARSTGVPFVWLPAGYDPELLAGLVQRGDLLAVSVVQHETGAIAPVQMIQAVACQRGATLVLDAVQMLGKLPLDVATTGAAAVAVSAHKVGGPTGVGACWLRPGVRTVARQSGGGQERGLRAGTENVLGVVGFGAAAGALGVRLAAMAAIRGRRDRVEDALRALDAVVNGAEGQRVATASHTSVPGVAGQELVAALDLEGFCVSSGAACSSGRPERSGSLLRLYPGAPWRAAGALRVTLGPETTDEDIARFLAVLPGVVARVRDV